MLRKVGENPHWLDFETGRNGHKMGEYNSDLHPGKEAIISQYQQKSPGLLFTKPSFLGDLPGVFRQLSISQ
jgi:hypothetical protein